MAKFPNGAELFVVEGDIVTFAVDAIVSNDDVDGRMWAAVASAVKLAAGSDVERESVSRGPYRLGSSWLTDGGNLPVKKIIHVAAMDHRGRRGELDNIRSCVREALLTANREGLRSVALGAIGTGTASPTIELKDWLREIGSEIVEMRELDRLELAVLIVLYEPREFDRCVEILRSVIPVTDRCSSR